MENEREVLVEVNHLNVTYGSGRSAYHACLLYTSDAADD